MNNLINRIYERALKLTQNDHVSTFQDIVEITKEKTIYQNNLECLAKEIYKFLNGLSPPIMNCAFMIRNNNYNLRNFQCLYFLSVSASSFDLFKKEIGKWKGEKCPCRICKTYIQHVGFI